MTEALKTEEELAAERMAAVDRQIHQKVPKGFPKRILCPYCGTWNSGKGRVLCCDLLRRAVVTVLVADRALEAAEAGERQVNATKQ